MKKLWIATTADEYELPIAVADTERELAEMLGVTFTCVSHLYQRKLKLDTKGRKYNIYKIKVEEE